jgi:gamma-glutamyltranspeptidase/glutathione hydrolase
MRLLPLLALLPALVACTHGPSPGPDGPVAQQPEAASGFTAKPGWRFQRQAVAAAHPLAADAGHAVLRAGGNAMDAAVAVQMVLALVEPQSSGIGGGAFLLHWDGAQVQAWDGRETAPAAADERLFLQPDGRPMAVPQAQVGGRAVGVPGVVRMLEAAHRRHGRLPWAQLLQPAIDLSERGFAITPRLHTLLAADAALRRDPLAAALYYGADGQARPVGHVLQNPALAAVLRALARQGGDALHQGPVAADIVARVRGHAGNPGRLSLADLAAYRPLPRDALCADWTPRWRICGMPPPSSGQLALVQMLKLADLAGASARPLDAAGVPSVDWLHVYTEAARLAFADRALYVADPAHVAAPAGRWGSLLDEAYLRRRAALIGPRSMGTATAGVPDGATLSLAPQAADVEQGTSHVSIVDADGHAVAMTTSVEAAFGARLLSDGGSGLPGGFVLNNQLTDFAFQPHDTQGRPVANRVQPGKRPRSTMSPTLVFDRGSGQLVLVAGSPGGPSIVHVVAKTLLGTLAWGLDAQRALDLPNVASFNGPTLLEKGRFAPAAVDALKARGHTVNLVDMPSGAQALMRTPEGWSGGADPRREGVVRGD